MPPEPDIAITVDLRPQLKPERLAEIVRIDRMIRRGAALPAPTADEQDNQPSGAMEELPEEAPDTVEIPAAPVIEFVRPAPRLRLLNAPVADPTDGVPAGVPPHRNPRPRGRPRPSRWRRRESRLRPRKPASLPATSSLA